MSRTNIFESVNQQIFDFIHERPNRSLIRGTGAYSTPFRGRLFGESDARAVAHGLKTRRVDALWLGSNPNVPRSLANILADASGKGDFPEFERQMASGLFASCRWDERGNPARDFNPIQEPQRAWKVYAEILGSVFGSVECVTMANCIPWGSTSTKAFLAQLGDANPSLLKRVLAFSDDLNGDIVSALRPKLMLVPFSFGRESRINAVHPMGVAMAQATDCDWRSIATVQGTFRFCMARCRRGTVTVPTAYVPHPASLRLRRGTARRVVDGLTKSLEEFS